MENKKVKNATPTTFDGIRFKSRLEVDTYLALKSSGFTPEYEQYHFTLQEAQSFKTPVYMMYCDRKTGNRVWGLFPYKTMGIKYTPDFSVLVKGRCFIIECKGMPNDRYAYQKKLFLNALDATGLDAVFMEVHNKKELAKAIEVIKEWKENH